MVCELGETRTPFRDARVSCGGMYVLYVVEGRGWGLGVGGWRGLGWVRLGVWLTGGAAYLNSGNVDGMIRKFKRRLPALHL